MRELPSTLPSMPEVIRRSDKASYEKLKRLRSFEDDFFTDGELMQAYMQTCVVLSLRIVATVEKSMFLPFARAHASVSCQIRREEFSDSRLGCLVLALWAALEKNDGRFENQMRGAEVRYKNESYPRLEAGCRA